MENGKKIGFQPAIECGVEIVGASRNQPATSPLFARQRGAGQQQPGGGSEPDPNRQQGGSRGSEHSQLDFGGSKLGGLVGKNQVAGEHEFESSAEALAADGGDHGRGGLSDPPEGAP